MKNWLPLSTLLCTSLLFIATSFATAATNATSSILKYQILAERKHDATLFTQGLLVDNNKFYESSGLYHKSRLVSYYTDEPDPAWANIAIDFVQQQPIADQYFAEGLALHNNQLFLLTWQEKTLLVFDKTTLQLQKKLTYEGEGWGLTSDGKNLIRSDGSDTLFFHQPETFAITKSLIVTHENQRITNINELEYAQGFIWANIWYEDKILKIDPTTGKVIALVDLTAIKQSLHLSSREYVLNGIAWDEKRQSFWVTGKNWPKMFLIRIE